MSNECSTCLLRIDPLDELPTSALASREARSDSPDWPARIRDRLTPDRAAAAGCARIDVLRRKCLPASEPLRLRCVIFARTVEPIGGLHLAGRTWRDLSLLCRRGARARPRQTTAVSPTHAANYIARLRACTRSNESRTGAQRKAATRDRGITLARSRTYTSRTNSTVSPWTRTAMLSGIASVTGSLK
jgi:hypothetical protein